MLAEVNAAIKGTDTVSTIISTHPVSTPRLLTTDAEVPTVYYLHRSSRYRVPARLGSTRLELDRLCSTLIDSLRLGLTMLKLDGICSIWPDWIDSDRI